MTTAWSAIFLGELKLLFRNKAVVVSAVLLPLLFGTGFAFFGKIVPSSLGWAIYIAMQLNVVFGMTACVTAAASVSYRRDELYLKRLRCGEASDSTILLGVVSPVIVVTVVQSLLVLLITAFVAAAMPANPLLLTALLLGGTSMSVAMGVATTGMTSSGEQAQTMAAPFFFLLIGSMVWAMLSLPGDLNALQRLLPGGAVLELSMLAYDSAGTFVGQLADGMLPIVVLLGWTALGLLAVRQYFKWEPRN